MEKVGKILFNLYIYPNLGKGMILNKWILSIHRYLCNLIIFHSTDMFFTKTKCYLVHAISQIWEAVKCQHNFFVMHLFFRSEEVDWKSTICNVAILSMNPIFSKLKSRPKYYGKDRLSNSVFLSPSLCTKRPILFGRGNSTNAV